MPNIFEYNICSSKQVFKRNDTYKYNVLIIVSENHYIFYHRCADTMTILNMCYDDETGDFECLRSWNMIRENAGVNKTVNQHIYTDVIIAFYNTLILSYCKCGYHILDKTIPKKLFDNNIVNAICNGYYNTKDINTTDIYDNASTLPLPYIKYNEAADSIMLSEADFIAVRKQIMLAIATVK